MSPPRHFDHVGITVADLDMVTGFFVGLGFEIEGRTVLEGEFLDTGADYVEQLASLAARTGRREFVIRSHIHRARLGQPGAVEAAVIGVAQVDNPVLADLVEEAGREQ